MQIVEFKSLVTRLNTNILAAVKHVVAGCLSSEMNTVPRNITLRQSHCSRIFKGQNALAKRVITGDEMTEVSRVRLA